MPVNPDVSIVIRTKNEGKTIGRCLQMVYAQNTTYDVEVIVIDSGSTDDTLEICRNYPVIIHQIPPSDFNFGRTLNLGAELAQGNYMVALTAHAFPANDNWLQPLVSTLESDDSVAGAYSRQLPKPGCNPFEAIALMRTFGGTPLTVSKPAPKAKNVVFSNASSCLRKDVMASTAFRELTYAEDRDWARRVVQRGYKIAYVPESKVFHSHSYNLAQWYRVVEKAGRAFFEIDGDQRGAKAVLRYLFLPSVLRMYRRYLVSLRNLGLHNTDLHKWAILCLAYSCVRDCGEFVGSRFRRGS